MPLLVSKSVEKLLCTKNKSCKITIFSTFRFLWCLYLDYPSIEFCLYKHKGHTARPVWFLRKEANARCSFNVPVMRANKEFSFMVKCTIISKIHEWQAPVSSPSCQPLQEIQARYQTYWVWQTGDLLGGGAYRAYSFYFSLFWQVSFYFWILTSHTFKGVLDEMVVNISKRIKRPSLVCFLQQWEYSGFMALCTRTLKLLLAVNQEV